MVDSLYEYYVMTLCIVGRKLDKHTFQELALLLSAGGLLERFLTIFFYYY
jgi:hypothetical protein